MIQDIIKKTVDIIWIACTSLTQEVVVGIIGVTVLTIIVYKLYRSICMKKEKTGTCGCVSCGCSSAQKKKKYTLDLDLKKETSTFDTRK